MARNDLTVFHNILQKQHQEKLRVKEHIRKRFEEEKIDENFPISKKQDKISELIFEHHAILQRLFTLYYRREIEADDAIGRLKEIRKELRDLLGE